MSSWLKDATLPSNKTIDDKPVNATPGENELRKGLANTQMFNPKGAGTGVWVGHGLTKTKPAPTLFITMIPNGLSMEAIDTVFKAEPGYFAFRTVRQMVFIDYNTTYAATAAMRKLQDHKFPGFESSRGIAIDYGTVLLLASFV
jgi:hypothetical protein